MLEQDKRGISPTPEQVASLLDRLFPNKIVGIKIFVHKETGVRIQINRHRRYNSNDVWTSITLMKVFGEPNTEETPVYPYNFPIEVSETFYIDSGPFNVKREQTAWVNSLTGKRRDVFVQRDSKQDEKGFEIFDLSNDGPGSLTIGPMRYPTRNQSTWSELFKMIAESTRVHPYTGEELPYWEDTGIDRYMSSVDESLDNVTKQLNHLGDEGVAHIIVETEINEDGTPHFSVSPGDQAS